MLKNEFEEAIGFEVSQREFNNAMSIYRTAFDLSEKDFVNAWKISRVNGAVMCLINCLYDAANSYKNELFSVAAKNEKLLDECKKIEEYEKDIETLQQAIRILSK